jgi:hypothetical protein
MTTVVARARRTSELVFQAELRSGIENWIAALSSAEQLLRARNTRIRFERRVNGNPRRQTANDAPATKRRRSATPTPRLIPTEPGP